jgi:hypothetical protein
MNEPMHEEHDALNDLFTRYRAACPEPDASAGFMPGLWQRIDARRSFAFRLRMYARGLATVAAAICLAVGIFGTAFNTAVNPFYTQTYIDALDAENSPETLAFADVIQTENAREQ